MGAQRPGHIGGPGRRGAHPHLPAEAGAGYLVGAVQRADKEGDLLHHSQVLLQVLQLLEEARGPEVHLIWAERDPTQPQGWGRHHQGPKQVRTAKKKSCRPADVALEIQKEMYQALVY